MAVIEDAKLDRGQHEASGLERAVFGYLTRDQVDSWLNSHVRARLSAEVSEVLFRSGRIGAVYGLRLNDGNSVVVKVYRKPLNTGNLSAISACQRLLADTGYPCPAPLDGPATTEGHTATIESLFERGQPGDAHEPATRKAMARSLVAQLEILRAVPAAAVARDQPAWAVYDAGPWPTPHDSIFDFSTTQPRYQWLDDIARDAADGLGRPAAPEVIGHSDWVCQNVLFADGKVAVAYDWDSLVGESEAVLAGFGAGAYTQGSTGGTDAPAPEEVAAFLDDFDDARGHPFTTGQQVVAASAATWIMAYNARCGVSLEGLGYEVDEGSALRMLERYRHSYLRLRW
jgi:hypothetical protein